MIRNTLTGWQYPAPPQYKSQELVFEVSFQQTTMRQVGIDANGRPIYRTLFAGIGYPITGLREGVNGLEVMTTDSKVLELGDLNAVGITAKYVSNSWAGAHTEEYDINKLNAKSRRAAIKAGKAGYGFYVSPERHAQPIFYVPTRPQRNQVNGNLGADPTIANLHARLHEPTPATIAGKEDTPSEKHPLTDR